MKNKGFTLIELLAVIVILAIIALIATPIVLGMIEDSRESSKKISAGNVVSAVESAYNLAYANNMGMVPTLDQVKEAFNMRGATWTGNTIKTNDDVTCTITLEDVQMSVACENYDIESATMAVASE